MHEYDIPCRKPVTFLGFTVLGESRVKNVIDGVDPLH